MPDDNTNPIGISNATPGALKRVFVGGLEQPVWSFLGGAVMGSLLFAVGSGWLGSLASGAVSGLMLLYLQEFLKAKKVVEQIEKTACRTLSEVELIAGLSQLAELAKGLPERHREKYSSYAGRIPVSGGAVVVKARECDYLAQLSEILQRTQHSVMVTLRGGETPRFTLGWFFESSAQLSSDQRLAWLRAVRDARIQEKVRLLVYEESETDSFFENEANRQALLKAMLHVRV